MPTKVQINYSFDATHGYPFRASAIVAGRIVAIGVSGQDFNDARIRLLARLEYMKPGKIPPASFVDIEGLTIQPAPERKEPKQEIQQALPMASRPPPRREWTPPEKRQG